LTLFGFSTENWKRDPSETEHLMHIAASYLHTYKEKLLSKKFALALLAGLMRFQKPCKMSYKKPCSLPKIAASLTLSSLSTMAAETSL